MKVLRCAPAIRAVPGVKSAALASVPLLHGWEWDSSTSVEGHPAQDGEDMQAFMNSPSPGYFATMGIPILEGRDFDLRDIQENAKVAIVNRRFAQHYFGDKSAIGRHLGRGNAPGTKLDLEIVGVVADTLYEGPREGVRRQVFVPNWGKSSVAFYVRTTMSPASAYGALRNEVKNLNASMPVYEMKTLGAQLDQILLTERLIALLSAGFGVLAGRAGGKPARNGGRAPDDVADPLAVEQCQRVDKDHARDPVAPCLGGAAHHHAARTGAGHHDVVQILVDQEIGDFGGLGLGGDAGAQLMLALGAAVQRRGIDRMPGGAQPVGHALPNPAALVRAMDQNECRHCVISLFLVVRCAASSRR